jgi:hypothetical protein
MTIHLENVKQGISDIFIFSLETKNKNAYQCMTTSHLKTHAEPTVKNTVQNYI